MKPSSAHNFTETQLVCESRPSLEATRARSTATRCGYCGEALHKKGLKFCGRAVLP